MMNAKSITNHGTLVYFIGKQADSSQRRQILVFAFQLGLGSRTIREPFWKMQLRIYNAVIDGAMTLPVRLISMFPRSCAGKSFHEFIQNPGGLRVIKLLEMVPGALIFPITLLKQNEVL